MPKYRCFRKECSKIRSEFSLFLNRKNPPKFETHAFCSDSCLIDHFEYELNDKWRRVQTRQKSSIPRPKIGTILMQTAFVTREQLDEAVEMQTKSQEGKLGEWLLRLGFVDEHQVTAALAKQYGLPLINLNNSNTKLDAVRMIPGKIAKRSGLVPVGFDDQKSQLRVAVSAPVDFQFQGAIQRMVGKELSPYIGDQTAIQELWERFYEPEELDLSTIPSYSSLEELTKFSREVIAYAIDSHAIDIQAELIHDFFWMRLDYAEETHHHFFRFVPADIQNPVPVLQDTEVFDYAV